MPTVEPATLESPPVCTRIRPPTRDQEPSPAAALDRVVVFNADDLGLHYAFNEGIRAAHTGGCLTSASVRANGYAYEHAIGEVVPACPALGIGVHLCLNEAAPVASPDAVPDLLTRGGHLRPGFLWLMRLARTPKGRDQIERELRAQIERLLRDGLRLDHVDSHKHVHMIPDVFTLVCRLASEYGIPVVRIVREPAAAPTSVASRIRRYLNGNAIKHALLSYFGRVNAYAALRSDLLACAGFVGVRYTGEMNVDTVLAGLAAEEAHSVEVLLHPAIGPDPRDAATSSRFYLRYLASPHRQIELATLCAPELRAWLGRHDLRLTNFAGLAAERDRRFAAVERVDVDPAARRLCSGLTLAAPPWVSEAATDARAYGQVAIAVTKPGERVLDVGTGTGVLAIAMAKFGRLVTATDISPAAVRTACANAARHDVTLDTRVCDLLDGVEGRFDWIVFSPPYNTRPDGPIRNVAKRCVRKVPWIHQHCGQILPDAVLRFHQRLFGRLVRQAPPHLNPGGRVLVHAFASEMEALRTVLPGGARTTIFTHPDLDPFGTVAMCVQLA